MEILAKRVMWYVIIIYNLIIMKLRIESTVNIA